MYGAEREESWVEPRECGDRRSGVSVGGPGYNAGRSCIYAFDLPESCHEPKEGRAVHSPISAEEVLDILRRTGLDHLILSQPDPCWDRFCFGMDPEGNRLDR